MTATQRQVRAAAVPVTAPAPAGKTETRPPLRIVQPGERARLSQRRRARAAVIVTSVLLALGLFGVVVAHVVLTQNQFELQKVQRQAAEQQARYERLREQVAELESPSRIVQAAQERLGMVPPPSVKYLTPKASTASTRAAAPSTADNNKADEQAMTEWSTVKRHLGSRP